MPTEETAPVAFTLSGPGTPLRELLRSLWSSRTLIGVLARKDFFVRYRRTRLGLVWAIALPLIQAVVLTVVFSNLVPGGRGSQADPHTPYSVFVFAGMVPWSFFSSAFLAGATAVVDGANLAQRIYFPRMVLPLVAVTTAIFPLVATLLVLLAMIVGLGPGLALSTLWVLPGIALGVLLCLALSLVFSAAQVYLRDLRFAVSSGMTVLFYLTPVIYPVSRVPHELRLLVELLPAAGPVELFRKAVGSADAGLWRSVVASLVWIVVAGAAGLALHSKRDRVLADLL